MDMRVTLVLCRHKSNCPSVCLFSKNSLNLRSGQGDMFCVGTMWALHIQLDFTLFFPLNISNLNNKRFSPVVMHFCNFLSSVVDLSSPSIVHYPTLYLLFMFQSRCSFYQVRRVELNF